MKDPRDAADRAGPTLDELATTEEPRPGVEFTEAEWRRLVFLRWLYRTGRLTEWA